MRLFISYLLFATWLFVPSAYGSDQLKIVTSIKPIAGLTKAIGGEHVDVETILHANPSEHVYQLKPQDVRNIQSADLIFWIGPSLETYLKKPLKTNQKKNKNVFSLMEIPGIKTLPIREGLEWEDSHDHSHHHDHQGIDPHIWLDPDNALKIITWITAKLSEQDPAHSEKYAKNAQDLSQKITSFDRKATAEFSETPQKGFLVFHDGYQYFEKHFHLKAAGAISFGHDQGLTPQNIEKILKQVKEKKINCLFVEPGQEARIIEKIAHEKHIYLGQLDPMGSLINDDQDHYLHMLSRMKDSFNACFTYQQKGNSK